MKLICFSRGKLLNDFGLSEEIISLIKGVFNHYPKIEAVKIFGSRVKGNFRANSDIDLVFYGVDKLTLGKIALDLDELPTPYKFDLKAYELINHPKLKNHIDRIGKIFYKP